MARKSVRRSQAVTPFGIGALVDFRGQSLMAAGLDVWPNQPECQIHDDRLARRLDVEYFRSPPPPPEDGHQGAYLPFVRFPLWHFCPRCRTMKRTNWNDAFPPRCDSILPPLRTGAPPCATLPERRRWRMVPLRFIIVCENGHIDDFPWILWAHSRPGQSLVDANVCSNPLLRFNYTGKAGLMGLLVKCESCNAKARSLMGSAGPNSLKGLACEGNRPWLGPHGKETCSSPNLPRMLQRGATNLYFPKIASSILIPPFSDPIRKIVDDAHNWSVLTTGVEEGGSADQMRLRVFAEMKKLDFQHLKEVVTQKLTGVGLGSSAQTEEEFRLSEYWAMLESTGTSDQEFVTVKPDMDDYDDLVCEYIDQIVLVEKLAETRVLTGFSRINPPPYREFDQGDKSQLSLESKSWLPGVRVYGEGIFFTLKKARISGWLDVTDRRRYEEIFANHKRIYAKLGRKPREIHSKFFLLHTLAHVLIRRLSYECGYGSASLRERIYCWEGDKREMNGVLIYTAAGDSEGTMGGLVEQGKPGRFELLLLGALEDALWCSTDPLCIESHGQGIDSLNRAACHACALLPETSCEEGNRFLDRAALIGKPDESSLGFFSSIVQEMLSGTID
ncbi:MAG: DUF1998 domain-containing protein [candidate division Zixibacteria bacterium]|nr:DUF1998 domain-containing protein [candidate division Zixibacteria bacterium]MBU1469864.1 DUF1998 domain-containing protein [candidate division Zixibacteria bacterium]MBU2626610.1 DUF1998 domain-containing protein [candidate division Zixibacteria bacterium]